MATLIQCATCERWHPRDELYFDYNCSDCESNKEEDLVKCENCHRLRNPHDLDDGGLCESCFQCRGCGETTSYVDNDDLCCRCYSCSNCGDIYSALDEDDLCDTCYMCEGCDTVFQYELENFYCMACWRVVEAEYHADTIVNLYGAAKRRRFLTTDLVRRLKSYLNVLTSSKE